MKATGRAAPWRPRGTPFYFTDISTDPLWWDCRDIAIGHGLRACWSTPIRGTDAALLGTFAIYCDEPRAPTQADLGAIAINTQTAALAIERFLSDRRLVHARDPAYRDRAGRAEHGRRAPAAGSRPDHHSDRGIQYAAEAYRQALAASGLTPSMSRKGDCWDNAPMESFFHTLKTERVHRRVHADRDQARRDLFGYIEGFYNSRRLHSALGYVSPAEAERRAA